MWKSISDLEITALIKRRPVCRFAAHLDVSMPTNIYPRRSSYFHLMWAHSVCTIWVDFNRYEPIRLASAISSEYGSLGFSIFPVTCLRATGAACVTTHQRLQCNPIYRCFFLFLTDSVNVCSVNFFIFNQMRSISSCVPSGARWWLHTSNINIIVYAILCILFVYFAA